MNIFIPLIFALCALGVLAICSIEPVRRSFLESMAITVLFGFSGVVAVMIYLGIQSI